jgi:hypothetical protein
MANKIKLLIADDHEVVRGGYSIRRIKLAWE